MTIYLFKVFHNYLKGRFQDIKRTKECGRGFGINKREIIFLGHI